MNVSTIITTHKRPELLDKTLKSISKTDIARSNITVLIDETDNKTEGVLRKYNFIDDIICSLKNRGLYFVWNVATEVAKFNQPDFINILQDDVEVKEPKCLEKLIGIWDGLDSIGAISGWFNKKWDKDTRLTHRPLRKKSCKDVMWRNIKVNLRKHASAQHLFIGFQEWIELYPFPYDYHNITSGERIALPSGRMCSGCDWYISETLTKQGKFCATVDFINHIGEGKSTWQDNEYFI